MSGIILDSNFPYKEFTSKSCHPSFLNTLRTILLLITLSGLSPYSLWEHDKKLPIAFLAFIPASCILLPRQGPVPPFYGTILCLLLLLFSQCLSLLPSLCPAPATTSTTAGFSHQRSHHVISFCSLPPSPHTVLSPLIIAHTEHISTLETWFFPFILSGKLSSICLYTRLISLRPLPKSPVPRVPP